ncbi:MAG: DRTGG domain-containing protein [Spirochaetota bacterium]|nr:DRTGG domain-containing protein [Spirochaetota bacterium]
MKRIIVGSVRGSAGKTSVIVGLAEATKKSIAYLKPFGDRLFYKEKKLIDYDFALMKDIFSLSEDQDHAIIGFEHSKMRYLFDENSIKKKLNEMISHSKGKDILIIEGGKDIGFGISVHLDTLSLAKDIDDCKLIIVISGNDDTVLDDIYFVKKHIDITNIDSVSVIINKVQDIKNFENTYLNEIKKIGLNILGILPYRAELTYLSVNYLAESLMAKVVTGEEGLNKRVENILVGAMSADAVLRYPPFQKQNKLVITSGDRSDMILAALESNTSAILLTTNTLPPVNIISKASEHKIPLLLVPYDTYESAKRVEKIEALITKDDLDKRVILKEMVDKYLNISEIIKD